ncbi:microtubule-associated protein futsch isoform X1 [Athalia rosae]|uniref:microtubule-associated protein futsch isoform X1 n=1 Tax=Athalia rosae TaxID=37344 RepID=UPI002034A223|nr:microtubule-associated protein futsch isoform X1 [Athalia rosae]XP_048507214.1 microtubule-associated protein futsch isoform X1 [Athalia rosae]XP_048507215.1 microtubule-associated protein futsch isoform X1 [Athalia rosae]XP_048507216.1 microtubule-associated protein futsch isoform X1 [Athalia rosae]XP_048507218.1 microtubule-associated protein futsch isoform X1 [Athalia rosae]
MWWASRWLLLAVTLMATTRALPVPEEEVDTSTKLLGSSVVTSVSVVMGHEDGNDKNAVADSSEQKKGTDSLPASPVDMMKPESFQFYTVDDKGQLITRQMTDSEIQSIIAAGGGAFPAESQDSEKSDNLTGEMKVADVVQNVQNVLKEELSKPAAAMGTVPTIPGHVNSEWSSILPSILGAGDADSAPVTSAQSDDSLPAVFESEQKKKPSSVVPQIVPETQTNPLEPSKPEIASQPETILLISGSEISKESVKPNDGNAENEQKPEVVVKPAEVETVVLEKLKPLEVEPSNKTEVESETPIMIEVPVITADSVHEGIKETAMTEDKPVYQILNTISADELKNQNSAVPEKPKPASESETKESVAVAEVEEKKNPEQPEVTMTDDRVSVPSETVEKLVETSSVSSVEDAEKSKLDADKKEEENPPAPSISLEAPVAPEKPAKEEEPAVVSEESAVEIKLKEPSVESTDDASVSNPEELQTPTPSKNIIEDGADNDTPTSQSTGATVEEIASTMPSENNEEFKTEVKPEEVPMKIGMETELEDSKEKIVETVVSSDDKKPDAETVSVAEPALQIISEATPDESSATIAPEESVSASQKIETETAAAGAEEMNKPSVAVDSTGPKISEDASNTQPELPEKKPSVSDPEIKPTEATIGDKNEAAVVPGKKPEPILTELADSVSSMISQVSDTLPAMVPIPQKSEVNEQPAKRVEEGTKTEEEADVETAIKTEVMNPAVPEVTKTQETEAPAENESEKKIVMLENTKPASSDSSPESEETKAEKPSDESEMKLDSLKTETPDAVNKLEESKTEIPSQSDDNVNKNKPEVVAVEVEDTLEKQEVVPDAEPPKQVMPSEEQADKIKSDVEAPIVRIDITEAKPTDLTTEINKPEIATDEAGSTESSVVRIQLTNPVATINQMMDAAPAQVPPVSVEEISFPENKITSSSAENVGSSLIAGEKPSEIKNETDAAPVEQQIDDAAVEMSSVEKVEKVPEIDAPKIPESHVPNTKVGQPTETAEPGTSSPIAEYAETKITNVTSAVDDGKPLIRIDIPIPSVNIEHPKATPTKNEELAVTEKIAEPVVPITEPVKTEESSSNAAPAAEMQTTEINSIPTEKSDIIEDSSVKPSMAEGEKSEEMPEVILTTENLISADPSDSAVSAQKDSELPQVIPTEISAEQLPDKLITDVQNAEAAGPPPSQIVTQTPETTLKETEKLPETSDKSPDKMEDSESAAISQSTKNDENISSSSEEKPAEEESSLSGEPKPVEESKDENSAPATEEMPSPKPSAPVVRIDVTPEKNDPEILAAVMPVTDNSEKESSVAADNDNYAEVPMPEILPPKIEDFVLKKPENSGTGMMAVENAEETQPTSESPEKNDSTTPKADAGNSPVIPATESSTAKVEDNIASDMQKVDVQDIEKPMIKIDTPLKTQEIRIQVNDTAVLVTKQPVSQQNDIPKIDEPAKELLAPIPNSLINKPVEISGSTPESKPTDPKPASNVVSESSPKPMMPPDQEFIKNTNDIASKPSVAAKVDPEKKKPAADPYIKLGEEDKKEKPVDSPNASKAPVNPSVVSEDKWTLIPQNSPASVLKQQHADQNKNDDDSQSGSSVTLESHQSAVSLQESTRNLDKDIASFAKLCNDLAFSFWIATNHGLSTARSLALSPFGMTSMLAMVFLGARGPTSGQMNDILGLDDVVTFNPHLVFQNITDSVNLARGQGIANAAFVRELFSDRVKAGRILPFYKERAQQFYDGHVEEVNFATISDLVRRRTNLLIRRQTGGRIRDFVKGNVMPLRSPLAALSANVFQTDCTGASSDGRDGEMYFAVLPAVRQRKLVPVPAAVWRSGVLAGYEPGLDATVISLGGVGDLVSTIFVLPGQQGLAAPGDSLDHLERRLLEGAFENQAWERLLKVLIPRVGLEVQVPKFSHRSVINATAALKRMGLDELFSRDADLKGVNGVGNDLFLADMLQINLFSTCGDETITGGRHHVEIYPATPLRGARGDANKLQEVQEEQIEEGKVEETSSNLADDDHPIARRSVTVADYINSSQAAEEEQHSQAEERSIRSPVLPKGSNVMGNKAKQTERPRLKIDGPCLFFVRHNPTGMILNMGRFNPRLMP